MEINQYDKDGRTPLMNAAIDGNLDEVKTGDEKYRNQEYQKQNNPVCVELLYNLPFKNNEYLFEDIYGIKIAEV